jgi:hypothetical protein
MIDHDITGNEKRSEINKNWLAGHHKKSPKLILPAYTNLPQPKYMER